MTKRERRGLEACRDALGVALPSNPANLRKTVQAAHRARRVENAVRAVLHRILEQGMHADAAWWEVEDAMEDLKRTIAEHDTSNQQKSNR